MSGIKINNELTLTYPDHFQQMGEDELTKYFSSPKNRWGVYDEANHIILSVSWTKGGFFSFMTDAESMLTGVEARMCRNLLNYQRISSYQIKIAKKKAYAIRFEYRVNAAKLVQVGDLITFKYKGKFYAIHYITRKTNAGESRRELQNILNSITLG